MRNLLVTVFVLSTVVCARAGSLNLYYNSQCVASDGGYRLFEGTFVFPEAVVIEGRFESNFVMGSRASSPPYSMELRVATCDGGANVLPFLGWPIGGTGAVEASVVCGCLRPRTCERVPSGFNVRLGLRFVEAVAWFPDADDTGMQKKSIGNLTHIMVL